MIYLIYFTYCAGFLVLLASWLFFFLFFFHLITVFVSIYIIIMSIINMHVFLYMFLFCLLTCRIIDLVKIDEKLEASTGQCHLQFHCFTFARNKQSIHFITIIEFDGDNDCLIVRVHLTIHVIHHS